MNRILLLAGISVVICLQVVSRVDDPAAHVPLTLTTVATLWSNVRGAAPMALLILLFGTTLYSASQQFMLELPLVVSLDLLVIAEVISRQRRFAGLSIKG
jgi:uncharacterized membrane protein